MIDCCYFPAHVGLCVGAIDRFSIIVEKTSERLLPVLELTRDQIPKVRKFPQNAAKFGPETLQISTVSCAFRG